MEKRIEKLPMFEVAVRAIFSNTYLYTLENGVTACLNMANMLSDLELFFCDKKRKIV